MNSSVLRTAIVLLHLASMSKQLFFGHTVLQDSREYLFAADNLLNEGRLYAWNLTHAYNPDWLTKRPFLYPAILAGLKWLSAGNNFVFLLLIYGMQNLVSLFSLNLAVKTALRLGAKISPLKTLVFLLFSVSQFIYANLIMCEIWLQFCLIAGAYVLLFRSESPVKYLLLTLLLIASVSLKPVMMFAVYLIPLLYLIFRHKRFVLPSFILCLLPILYVHLISYVNEKRSGYYHYSSISNINLLHYNTYTTIMYRSGQRHADSVIDDIHTRAQVLPSYADEQALIRGECTGLLKAHAGTYMYLHLRGMLFSMLDPGRYDITQFFGLPHRGNLLYESNKGNWAQSLLRVFSGGTGMLLLALLLFNCYRLFAVIRFSVLFRRKTLMLLTLFAYPAYLITMTGPIGTSRFFMPVIPFAFIMFLMQASKNKKIQNS